MAEFAYTGHGPGGSVSGTLDAPTAGAVAEMLQARGITPLRIQAGAAPAAPVQTVQLRLPAWRSARVGTVDLLLFSRQLNTLLRAGVPILRALGGLIESAANPAMRATLASVRQTLESGRELSQALASHPAVFDAFYIAMVRVGEATGRLDEVFLRLFRHLEFEQFMRQQVRSALRYPSFVVAAMVIAVAVINLFVIPAFDQVFRNFGAELPWMTRMLMATSAFTVQFGWLLALGAVAGFVALRRWAATPAGRLVWDRLKLRLPVAGKIVHKATLSRFARSFALSLRSGVPVAQALAVVSQTVDNRWIGQRVEGIRDSVERGETILRAAALAGIFTPVVLQMIAVGEETGAVDELMDEVADLYARDVEYELKTLSQQIEPILIVFLGVLVLILALGVFLPVWDLGRAAFKK
ncbi:MAG: type II secretion system F family protein [Burkholderiales bacterium]|nr:type II secretion system F family protein [Burkholderiales bacterium]